MAKNPQDKWIEKEGEYAEMFANPYQQLNEELLMKSFFQKKLDPDWFPDLRCLKTRQKKYQIKSMVIFHCKN